ncbi:MAG: hypothetical protein IKF19_04920 [Bacilli bacterium]|nr:hypothetical protein [Bacilli bacterium]
MEDLGLRELFDFILDKIFLLILIIILVCMLGCVYGLFIQKPIYSSYTTVVLGGDESKEKTESITQNDVTLNQNLVETYAEIVKSKRVLNQVINELKLNLTFDELSRKINVTAVNDTEIIRITVTDENAVTAKNIANTTATYFTSEIVKLYSLNNVNILDKATVAKRPYNISITKQLLIYTMIGIVVGFGILFVIYYFDRTIKSAEQIEQKIKLPILGSVENYGRRKRR